jgi:integrase-like protein
VLFDIICRKNAITHRLTQPASPTTTGKIERFHLTLRRELLDDADSFESLADAQVAVNGFVARYNADRPHQALDSAAPVVPAERFTPATVQQREVLELWLPPALSPVEGTPPPLVTAAEQDPTPQAWVCGPVEFDRVVPASGNLTVTGRQFWMGPSRAG